MELTVHRAPIQHQLRGDSIPPPPPGPRTRCGYLVPEAYGCYMTALGEQGAVASGKLLHFAADIVCSGGFDLWTRGVYEYAFSHIGLANPRIFVYLRDRIAELEKKAAVLPQEAFYAHPDVQSGIAEAVLVLQLCPRRARTPWPKIGDDTRREGWLRGVAGSPETRATRTVWTSEGDMPALYLVGNELCKAIQDGATERALFWVKWCLEEDGRLRKATKGSGLSTRERGPATASAKARADAGYFLAALLSEIYKEFATKGLLRMNEEFQELIRLYRGGESRMPAKLRRDCLGLMILICAEVPRWKVPAAGSLVADPVRLSRAVGQGASFFHEVLAHTPLAPAAQLKSSMARAVKQKKTAVKEVKLATLDEHFDAYDAALDAYLSRSAAGPVRKV